MTESQHSVPHEPAPPDVLRRGPGLTPPPGAGAMALVRWLLVALMATVAALSVAYSFDLWSPREAAAGSAQQYYCPMHPQVVQDQPGECPICNMSLVPKPAALEQPAPAHQHTAPEPPAAAHEPAAPGQAAPGAPSRDTRADPTLAPVPGLAPLTLAFERVQRSGMRTALATEGPLGSELRTVAVLAADEARTTRVHPRFAGWIESQAVATTGQRVSKGDVLARVYTLELLPAQQEFLAARRWQGPAGSAAPAAGLAADARQRLELLGLSPREIERIGSSGQPTSSVEVVAPRAGHVTRKQAVEGGYIQPDTELFTITDLSRLWALADVFEQDMARVHAGQRARIELDAYPGVSVEGSIELLYPTLDAQSRTVQARILVDNPRLALRPGMYAHATIQLDAASGVLVPSEAVIDSGEHQYVFVALAEGRFEPRSVRLGARAGDQTQVLAGVMPGERVVTTGNFLLDSESRLGAAVAGAR